MPVPPNSGKGGSAFPLASVPPAAPVPIADNPNRPAGAAVNHEELNAAPNDPCQPAISYALVTPGPQKLAGTCAPLYTKRPAAAPLLVAITPVKVKALGSVVPGAATSKPK